MAGVTGKKVTALRNSDEDVANANNPQHAAKAFSSTYAEGDITTTEDDDDVRKPSNKPSSIEMPAMAYNNSGPKTPVPGTSSSTGTTAVTVSRSKSEKEKKGQRTGHRRVTDRGDVTYKKIQTSQIMGSIQLGVQHAIGGLASKPERDLLMQDFMTVEQTIFPNGGSNQTPAHHYSDFRFKTYAPIAFRYFRDLFGIQPDDFLMSMCSVPMRELSNPGASGSIFYLTDDDEFIVKTVQHKECEFLQKLLPGYYMNLNQNPRTLLPKFFGLFCYQCNSKNVRLAVMNNLLPSSVKMHQKYDLKGSTYKRKASRGEREKAYPTFKDLDFLEHHPDGILLEADTCAALIKTMQRDCRVLESFKIMDYSLLVGIHNRDIAAREKAERKAKMIDSDDEEEEGEFTPGYGLSRSKSINRQKLVAHSTALESIQAESEPIDADEDVPPGGIPARNAKGERLFLFLGLIDILQSYRLKKKLEHTFKAMIHDGDTVSVHRPGFYAERFMQFMSKNVFRKIPSLDLPEFRGNHRKFRNLVSTFIALKHSPSKKRGPPMRIRPGDHGDGQDIGSPPNLTSPMSPSSALAISPPRTTPSGGEEYSSSHHHHHPLPPTSENSKSKRFSSSSGTVINVGNKEGKSVSIQDSSGGGGEGETQQQQKEQPTSPPPQPQQPPSYPAVLNKETRPSTTMNVSNKVKVPPPVPPRTPKRTNVNGTATTTTTTVDSKGLLDGSSATPLPVNTPPPPFQEKKAYIRGVGSNPGQSTPPPGQQWNLTQSQSPSRRVVSSGSNGAGSSASSSDPRHPHHRDITTESETVSISEVYVETRMHRSSLSVASSTSTSGVSSSLGHRMPRSPPGRNTSATPTWTEGTPSFTESSSSGDFGEDRCPTTPVKGAIGGTSGADGVSDEHEMTRL